MSSRTRTWLSVLAQMKALPFSGVYSASAALFATAVLAWRAKPVPPGPATTRAAFVPVALVTGAAVALLYIFLFNQSATTFGQLAELRREAKAGGKRAPRLAEVKYGGGNGAVLAADRLVGNYLEQLVPFLLSLFGHALFVSASRAAAFSWAWIFFRSYYGLAFGRPFPALLASTIPAYCCVWWMAGPAIHAAAALEM